LIATLRYLGAAFAAVVLANAAVFGQTVRQPPHAGQVIQVRGDEQLRLISEELWRPLVVRQDLLAGDTLRTGPFGGLALLFADQTQVRVGRNSVLTVREVSGSGPAALQLQVGNIWARAPGGVGGVTVETPSATAAVRGTDWTLSVDADGRTSLLVLEGTVSLTNDLGSVSVGQGEAAVAAIGQAPSKVVVVTPRDREQMLFYFDLRDAFYRLPATPLDRRAIRERHAALQATPGAGRSAEDWLELAETALALSDRNEAEAAMRHLPAGSHAGEQASRSDLVLGLLAGLDRDYALAVERLDRAARGLTGQRQVSALWGRYFAELLLGRGEAARKPASSLPDDATAAVARAYLTGFLGDIDGAIDILTVAEARYPGDVTLPALRSAAATLLYRLDEVESASNRAMAIDLEDPLALQASANRRYLLDNDDAGAAADLRAAVAAAPGDAEAWNSLGLILYEQNANREAERAYQRGIAADADTPLSIANYAILLLDQDRMSEAKAAIDNAMQVDPAYYGTLMANGRYLLQSGQSDKAREEILKANAANPAAADAVLGLAIAYYQEGDVARAEQALADAERLDPQDPTVPLVRSQIGVDRAEADVAIANAQEAFRRYRDQGGMRLGVDARRDGSYLTSAFSELTLNEWGTFYNELVFNPFEAGSHFGRVLAPRLGLLRNEVGVGVKATLSSAFQGLLLDPLAVASRERYTDFFRRPFLDGNAGGGFVNREGHFGWLAGADVQGFDASALPVSFYASVNALDTDGARANDQQQLVSGTLFGGANLSPDDRLLLFAGLNDIDQELPGRTIAAFNEDSSDDTGVRGTIGYSHTFGYRDVLMATAGAQRNDGDSHARDFVFDPSFGVLDVSADTDAVETRYGGAVAHLKGIGPFTLRYGVEGDTTLATTDQEFRIAGLPFPIFSKADDRLNTARAYADLSYQVLSTLQIEAGAYGTWLDGLIDDSRFEPRIGAAWLPIEGHWLRVAYRDATALPADFTLAPVTTVGLMETGAPFATGGRSKTALARWDGSWSDRFYTGLQFETQHLHDLAFNIPDTLEALGVGKGRLHRLSGDINAWIGGGFGVFGSVARNWTENEDPGQSGDLPLVPNWDARIGVSWVHPSQVRLTIAENFIGDRAGDLSGTRLSGYATTDLSITWQPLDRYLLLDLSVTNLMGEDFSVASDVPGPGRTVIGSIRARF
jgi:tetratricopeptide (TPR) repeat protein